MSRWTTEDIPDQTGRVALVTGANSGLGFRTAEALAAAGATVLLGCRNTERAADALASIRQSHPHADVDVLELDLASLDGVAAAATRVRDERDRLDLLINNAGVMAPPRRETADGFELQIGTNHLGHFALTGHLIELLVGTPGSRVVTVSSMAHHAGEIDLEDLNRERSYQRWEAYGQSKLANLLFTFELQRRLARVATDTIAVAAHPGYASTNLQTSAPSSGALGFAIKPIMTIGNLLFGQSDEVGALPQLRAATAPDVEGGEYYGPGGLREMRGYPVRVRARRTAYDEALAMSLWQRSEELTGVSFDVTA